MRKTILFSVLASLAFGQGTVAAQSDDANVIVAQMLDSTKIAEARTHIAGAFADGISGYLEQHSVTLRDRESFELMLPHELTDQTVEKLAPRMASTCFANAKSEDVSSLAAALREQPDLLHTPDKLTSGQNAVVMTGMMCYIGAINHVESELKAELAKPSSDVLTRVADVLELPGIANFPNPIEKKKLLDEMRAGAAE